MNPFQEKYHQTKGTHCWYCDREFIGNMRRLASFKQPLKRTREHIIPVSQLTQSIPKNYIAACADCNGLKGPKNARQFAEKVTSMIQKYKNGEHNMYKFFPMMRDRAWKLYNKTSKLHQNNKRP